jgi:hypothetical protein
MNNDDLHNSFKKEDKVENGLDYYHEILFIACGTEFSAMASVQTDDRKAAKIFAKNNIEGHIATSIFWPTIF